MKYFDYCEIDCRYVHSHIYRASQYEEVISMARKKKEKKVDEPLPNTGVEPKDTTDEARDTTADSVESTGLEVVEDDDDGDRSDK